MNAPSGELRIRTVIMSIIIGKGNGQLPKVSHKFLDYPSLDYDAELGLPNAQGWTQNTTFPSRLEVVDDMDGSNTVKALNIKDDSSQIIDYQRTLDPLGLQALYANGGHYRTRTRLDTANGDSGYFKGIMIHSSDNPAGAVNQRFPLAVTRTSGGDTLTINTVEIPNTKWDEYHTIEITIPPLFGDGLIYVDGVLTGAVCTLTNATVSSSQVWVTSGSSSGSNRITFHQYEHFVVYANYPTVDLDIDKQGGDVLLTLPEGRREYTINIIAG